MDEVQAMFRIQAFLPSVNQLQHLPGFLPCKGLQRLQPLPKPGQPHGHHGHAAQERQVPGQFPDTPIQLFPVIEALAQDDLPVHLDPGLIEHVHLFQSFPGKPIVQHPAAKLGIHGLKGNVDGL